MAKVKTSKSWEFNGTRATGFGDIKFDENGVSQELDQEVAQKLVNASPALSFDGEAPVIEQEEEQIKPKAIVVETKTISNDDTLAKQLAGDKEITVEDAASTADDAEKAKAAELLKANATDITPVTDIPEGEVVTDGDFIADIPEGQGIPGVEENTNGPVIPEGAADNVESEEEEEGAQNIDDNNADQQDNNDSDVKLTKEDLLGMKVGDLRAILTQAGVAEEEFSQFKGKENKEALVDFALSKI